MAKEMRYKHEDGADNASQKVPSAFKLFKPSWEGVKLNLVELIVMFLVPAAALSLYFIIALSAFGISGGHVSTTAIITLAIGGLAALVYAVLLGPAIVHVQLKSARLQKASFESAWATSKKFWWRYLLVSLAVGLVVIIGFILLVVPGIIFLRRYFLSQYALIDQDLGVRASMKRSSALSKDRSAAIFGIIGVDILISIANIIPVIGGVITFALQVVYFCAPAIRYEQLKALRPKA